MGIVSISFTESCHWNTVISYTHVQRLMRFNLLHGELSLEQVGCSVYDEISPRQFQSPSRRAVIGTYPSQGNRAALKPFQSPSRRAVIGTIVSFR